MKIGPADPEIVRLRANEFGTKQNWFPWQRLLRNWKILDQIKKIHVNSFPFGEKIVKIGPVGTEIALLILKNRKCMAKPSV